MLSVLLGARGQLLHGATRYDDGGDRECRITLAARVPRNTRAMGPVELETTTRSSAESEPPYAAVTRSTRASPLVRNPLGAKAIGTGELCSNRSVTLPGATCPKTPSEDEPTTMSGASCSSATSRRPAGAERAARVT